MLATEAGGAELLVEVDAAVGELAESSLLLELCVKRLCQLMCLECLFLYWW